MDLVVVGGGPAGLAAAAAGAERGMQVLLIDQGRRLGGQIWRHRQQRDLHPAAAQLLERVRTARVTVASEARVLDATSPRELVVDFRGRVDLQPTEQLILATGAMERFLPFPGWTLPGVMGVGGLQALHKSGLTVSGARVVLAGSGPLLFPVAATLARGGAELVLVAEQATRRALLRFGATLTRDVGKLMQAAEYRWAFARTPFRTGSWILRAEGDDRVREVVVSVHGRERRVRCDWLGASFGLVPQTELAQLVGCALQDGAIAVDALQRTSIAGVFAVGECTGVKGDAPGIVEGEIAGRAASGDTSGAGDAHLARARIAGRLFASALAQHFAVRPEVRQLATPETLLCRCEDVPIGAVDPAWSARQAKLYTRVGMGSCQGAICGEACKVLFGWEGNRPRPPLGAPMTGAWGDAIGRSGS
jgi:NADPH-dependent 2,4-dienoyl-CoA reductase/sulfur reductase-like enzyme